MNIKLINSKYGKEVLVGIQGKGRILSVKEKHVAIYSNMDSVTREQILDIVSGTMVNQEQYDGANTDGLEAVFEVRSQSTRNKLIKIALHGASGFLISPMARGVWEITDEFQSLVPMAFYQDKHPDTYVYGFQLTWMRSHYRLVDLSYGKVIHGDDAEIQFTQAFTNDGFLPYLKTPSDSLAEELIAVSRYPISNGTLISGIHKHSAPESIETFETIYGFLTTGHPAKLLPTSNTGSLCRTFIFTPEEKK